MRHLETIQVTLGDGTGPGEGTCICVYLVEAHNSENVLYAPKLSYSLKFDKRWCKIYQGNKVFAVATQHGICVTKYDDEMWHRRCGYVTYVSEQSL